MEKNYAYLFTADEIRQKFYEYVDMALPPAGLLHLANEQDIIRMAYMARGARDLADALIEEIEEERDE